MEPMTTIALRAARKAGEMIVRASDEIDVVAKKAKGAADFVTEVDIASERELLYHLRKAYPEHAFVCEESGRTGPDDAEYVWYIDPLDGTTNFMRGIPHYAISMACMKDGKLEHAVIVNPVLREEFVASRGRGVQLNGRRVRVAQSTELKQCLLGTGIPFLGHQTDKLPAYAEGMAKLAGQVMGIRRAGAASLDLAYVAAGRLDAFWEIGLKPWDIAAGALMIKEAGGLISDFNGGESYLDSGNVVCGGPKIFKHVLQTVGPSLR